VDACVKLVGAGPDFAQVRVEVDIAPQSLVLGEPGPLSQVLINLLMNAAQAQNGRGEIRVEGRQSGRELLVEVTDRGPGIAEGHLDRLFEPFFTTKGAGKGTGLGLSVSRHLVERMGGRLSAENAQGGGSRFTITLQTPP
jgi:signal transduction histidine kinase